MLTKEIIMTVPTRRNFAFIVDGEVIGVIAIPDVNPDHQRYWAGLASNPTVVDSTDMPSVEFGWTYDGQNFIAPENE
jgi:hypothetical protein